MYLNESRARTAESCLRKFFFFYLYGGNGLTILGRNAGKRLTWGTMIHAGLAAHYKGDHDIKEAITSSLHECIPDFEDLDAIQKNEWLAESDKIARIVNRYAEHYGDERLPIIAVEAAGEAPLGVTSHHVFVYRADLLVQEGPDGEAIRVWDHKSTSASVDANYLNSWEYSSQMWGYCYAVERQTGRKVGGYTVNIIRDVKAAVEAPDMTKTCPDCKNGSKKKLSCETCNQTGRVEREARPADYPFMRSEWSFTAAKGRSFVESRVRLADKIEQHQERLAAGDRTAFPRNPFACHLCPLTDICPIENEPKRPLLETFVPEERYALKGPDYVTLKRMQEEEQF